MNKIPVNIISGFLGSGKTTAIIKLFEQKSTDENWAVIVNEFGEISIDSQTLKHSSQAGKIFDVSGGCICCSAKAYFRENLDKIIQAGNYNRIIIEPTGLGGVDMITEIIGDYLNLMLMPIVCIVDITGIENSRLTALPIYRKQIQRADAIVFSKLDLLKEEAEQNNLIEKFTGLFPNKLLYREISINHLTLENRSTQQLNNLKLLHPVFCDDQQSADKNYWEQSYFFNNNTIFDPEKLLQLFSSYPSIIRAKGFIRLKNGWNLFNYTLNNFSTQPCSQAESNVIVVIHMKQEFEKNEEFEIDFDKAMT